MTEPTVVADLDPDREVVVCTGGSQSKGSVKVHLIDEEWCTAATQTSEVLASTLYADQEICEVCLEAVDCCGSDGADRSDVGSRDTVVPDGGEITTKFCASCTARVAREDRVTVDGQIYHQQCAPDTGAYDTEVPR
jgi:hypothetical protein